MRLEYLLPDPLAIANILDIFSDNLFEQSESLNEAFRADHDRVKARFETRFLELLDMSGLTDLCQSYTDKGYAILPNEPDDSNNSRANVQSKNVTISIMEIERHRSLNKVAVFTCILLHELGHVAAYEDGLYVEKDPNRSCVQNLWEKNRTAWNEMTAWLAAEKLCPVDLPTEWEEIRDRGLASRGLMWDPDLPTP